MASPLSAATGHLILHERSPSTAHRGRRFPLFLRSHQPSPAPASRLPTNLPQPRRSTILRLEMGTRSNTDAGTKSCVASAVSPIRPRAQHRCKRYPTCHDWFDGAVSFNPPAGAETSVLGAAQRTSTSRYGGGTTTRRREAGSAASFRRVHARSGGGSERLALIGAGRQFRDPVTES